MLKCLKALWALLSHAVKFPSTCLSPSLLKRVAGFTKYTLKLLQFVSQQFCIILMRCGLQMACQSLEGVYYIFHNVRTKAAQMAFTSKEPIQHKAAHLLECSTPHTQCAASGPNLTSTQIFKASVTQDTKARCQRKNSVSVRWAPPCALASVLRVSRSVLERWTIILLKESLTWCLDDVAVTHCPTSPTAELRAWSPRPVQSVSACVLRREPQSRLRPACQHTHSAAPQVWSRVGAASVWLWVQYFSGTSRPTTGPTTLSHDNTRFTGLCCS